MTIADAANTCTNPPSLPATLTSTNAIATVAVLQRPLLILAV
jgi:hypothetical protein